MAARLAIVATHPIQYAAPLFRRLAARADVEAIVFYEWHGAATAAGAHDPGFGRTISWDVPLLEGYPYEFVPNVARDPGTHHFRGIDNPDLVGRVLDWKPDALLVYGWAWKSHLRLMRALHGRVPILFRGDSTLLGETSAVRRFLRRGLLRWVYRHVDLALYPGTHARAYFRAHGVRDEQLVWAPHAVDNDAFAAHDAEREAAAQALRVQLGIAPGAPTFLFAGKLEPNKDPLLALRAFRLLDRPDAHLIAVGSGPMEKDVREAAAGSSHVHLLGFQNQQRMPICYRAADVLLLPSRSETWGLAVNEAMACGRPVIVSDRVGCAPDLVADPSVGRIVPAGDAAALAGAMAELAAEPHLRTAMRASARSTIGAWSLDRLADAVAQATVRCT